MNDKENHTKKIYITFILEEENSIYPIENREDAKHKWIKKDFPCGYPPDIESIHWVVVGCSCWSEIELRLSTELRS